ncbi:acetyltransferase [Actibacterium mucosum KCTC 23349]|uniref:Acetyltransferase n=1 Tax=Actibacterium mucosum KCTC 23349 TaxID=1454373 RepID=A0A037ZJ44_9RHOB|nr:GNAT family N-acetyltransferase [Actibacterium mucosum]KAJ56420.1 acetyltransferase [Actibacterium mucosum KCTC 23349]
MAGFTISAAQADAPEAAALISRHLSQMDAQSPEESCHAMGVEGLLGRDIKFFLIRSDDGLLGMGALKDMGGGQAELKSMHVVAEARGTGAGRAMLEHLLATARADGMRAISLETGSTDDFLPARRLYEAYGFAECGPFGDYGPDPWSVFMRLDLAPTA